MKYFNGTKGEWYYDADTFTVGTEHVFRNGYNYLDGLLLADLRCIPSQVEREANGELIAAAPELLSCLTMGQTLQTPEFLLWIADRLEFVHDEGKVDFVCSLRERANAMKLARDKALGEENV